MTHFTCQVCDEPFTIPKAALDKYPGWEKKGWTRKGEPLKNLDLVKELLELYRAHPNCPLEWTRAHDGSRWNEYADSLASAWRRSEL
jgi:ribonuclease HI